MQNVILNLRNEIIRSISAIDAWFDKDFSLLNEHINADGTVAEFLYNLVTASRNLLDAIALNAPARLEGPVDLQFPQDSLSAYRGHVDAGSVAMTVSLANARADLREQLDRCLIYLEHLLKRQSHGQNSFGDQDAERFGGFQGIYLLLIHLKRSLGDLNQLEERLARQR